MRVIRRSWWVIVAVAVQFTGRSAEIKLSANQLSGIIYTNYRVQREPWSIHVVKVERKNPLVEIRSMHAEGRAVGLSTLTEQIQSLRPSAGKPVAGINGDFYQRESFYAGDPRGLQIVDGDILSNPMGGACFWIDAVGEPHVDNIASNFQVVWPDGSSTPIEVNGALRSDRLQLYTEAVGDIPGYDRGKQIILEPEGSGSLSPLHVGKMYPARVKEFSDGTPKVPEGGAILAVGSGRGLKIPRLEKGAKLKILTLCTPNLRGIKTAIGGGPVLMRDGKRLRLPRGGSYEYSSSSMSERHPRTAIGWNDQYYFLMEVDGRQRSSVGMTLDELADFMENLGCENIMNFDGGGSATLWYAGKVRNRPCDGHERDIANSLVVVVKESGETGKSGN